MAIVSEKLRGFIADHNATIVSTTDTRVELKISSGMVGPASGRRRAEAGSTFRMEINFQEQNGQGIRGGAVTIVHAALSSSGRRDRRSAQYDAARSVLKSLKSYLVAQFCDRPESGESSD